MIQSKRWFLVVCMSCLFGGLVSSVVGLVMSAQMNALATTGVETIGAVTGLSTFTTRSGSGRSTTHRVAIDVEFGGQTLELVSDTDEATWNGLSEGGPVSLVFAADGSGLCLIGSRADAAEIVGLAKLVGWSGVGLLAIGGATTTWAWLSLGMPSFRQWANESIAVAPANPYAAA